MPTPRTLTSATDAFWHVLNYVPDIGKWKISPSERVHSLARMRLLLNRFDQPHLACQTFHVVGTKGKGSTAAFLASILNAAGYTTGLSVSPHVSDPAERISVAMAPPDESLVIHLVNQILSILETLPPDAIPGSSRITGFELMTLLAFLYFRATACQYAVIEAGVGGKFDATNILQPCACVFTPVDIEHTDLLGDTIAQIAREKSGVIKPGIPVFSSGQSPEVKQIFRDTSVVTASPIRFLDEELETFSSHIGLEGTDFQIKLRGQAEQRFTLRMLGAFQAENAALAYLVVNTLFPKISTDVMAAGLEHTFIPGRMERIQTTPPVILDGAHTPLAVKQLFSSFSELFPEKGVLLFGAIAGKKIEEMARILAPGFQEIIISTPGSFKTSDPEAVRAIFSNLHPCVTLEKDPALALKAAFSAAHDHLPILVTGSFFMISEIRKLLR